MKIKKALIAAAGYGTRFFPYTKATQKEMLPLLNRPLIDYVVDDCIKAGIEEIIIVINDKAGCQIKNYYSEDNALYEYLVRMGKPEKYSSIKDLHSKAKFTFVEQNLKGQYGTAVPLKLAQEYLKNEDAFLVFMGDDFIYNSDNSSEVSKMIQLFETSNSAGLLSCIQVDKSLTNKYGIIEFKQINDFKYLSNFVEKPDMRSAPTNLANISKYIFTPLVFKYLANQELNSVHGELFITDTVLAIAKDYNFVINVANGLYLDCGSVEGWLKANITLAKENPELWSRI